MSAPALSMIVLAKQGVSRSKISSHRAKNRRRSFKSGSSSLIRSMQSRGSGSPSHTSGLLIINDHAGMTQRDRAAWGRPL
jgi:hypothetical protein